MNLLYLARRVADLGLATDAEHNSRTAELLLLGGKIGLNAEELGATIDELVGRWRTWGELAARAGLGAALVRADVHPCTPCAPRTAAAPVALRVLLVDDDPTSRAIMETVLRDALGHSVVCARTGSEALALAVEAQPQIVITDWLMPGLSGLELHARAARHRVGADDLPDHAHQPGHRGRSLGSLRGRRG